MKKQLKIMSLLLSLVLLLASATPFTAKANGSINMDDNATLITPSIDAIYSVYGDAAPYALRNSLEALDISVSDKTLIEVVPLVDSTDGTALKVTNASGSTIMTDILVGFNSDGTIDDLIPIVDNELLPMSGLNANFPVGQNLLRAVAVFNRYNDRYVQPQGLLMYYNPNGIDTVTNVTAIYYAEGYECYYPGYAEVTGDNFNTFVYSIAISCPAPVANTVYSNTWSAYRTDRVIQVVDGMGAGQYVYFEINLNGQMIEGNVPLIMSEVLD